jgi:hypothetical protein
MKKLLVALALSLGLSFSVAAPVYQAEDGQGANLVLHDSPCQIEGGKGVPELFHAEFFVGGKKVMNACWAEGADGMSVFVGYEDGDVQQIPAGAFVLIKTA